MQEYVEFPEGFYWGASTSAHQVEGRQDNDWTEWETASMHRLAAEADSAKDYGNGIGTVPRWDEVALEAKNPQNYRSGTGVEHYKHWREDLELARGLGMTALRFSVEWSRVQPTPAVFNKDAINHYRDVVAACEELGMTPFITLHHFTNPRWLAAKGGWEQPDAVNQFQRYVERVVPVLATERNHWLVVNEPEVYGLMGWLAGAWPPERRNPLTYLKVQRHLIEAHKRSYESIKAFDESAQVASAVNNTHFEAADSGIKPFNQAAAKAARWLVNRHFREKTQDQHDFIGLNHYMHCVIGGRPFANDPEQPRSDLGWFIHPESIYQVLSDLQRYDKPIVITENGLADAADRYRGRFVQDTLYHVHRAIQDGVDVRGYLHWSLLDNFEWDKGYWPKFGLVSVNRATMERTPRPSAYTYSQIMQDNGFWVRSEH